MVENTNKIYWNFNNDEGVESPKNKGKLNGKVKKSKYKSNIDGNNRHLNKETVNELRKCLIFGKKDNYEAKVNV